jgi:hypothetical protein
MSVLQASSPESAFSRLFVVLIDNDTKYTAEIGRFDTSNFQFGVQVRSLSAPAN